MSHTSQLSSEPWRKCQNYPVLFSAEASNFLQCPRRVSLRFAWRGTHSQTHIFFRHITTAKHSLTNSRQRMAFCNFVGYHKAGLDCCIPGCVKLGKKALLPLQLSYQTFRCLCPLCFSQNLVFLCMFSLVMAMQIVILKLSVLHILSTQLYL